MKCSGTFMFQICLSLVVSTCSCSCKPLDNNIKTEDLEGYYTLLSEQNLIEEEDTELSLGNFLDTVKERFLRKLNLSDAPIEQGKIYPPPFMMELYNTYASNSTGIPQSDVIRSFAVQGATRLATNGTKSKHRLLFNVSFPSHEKVTSAELRLFLLADSRLSVHPHTVKATVKVYDVDCNGFKAESHLLGGTEIHAWRSSWAKFDVTKAVQSWVRLGYEEKGFLVAVDNGCAPFHEGIGGGGCLDVSASVGDNASAALIVFSDDMGSKRRENKHELKEMILREEEAIGFAWNGGKQLQNEIPEALHPKRERRKAEREYCRKTSLKVNFKDIGWDSWIVAPPEYDAFECRGLCYHPLTDESTPSKHALIQTLINIRNPKKANMACCVPIKLDPITVMYQENGQLTIRYLYEEMKVAECGCR